MNKTLKETHFTFPGQTGFYRGKVRDVYFVNDLLIMVATDRISAFDVVLPRAIPYKGQVLNQIANYFLDALAGVVPNWKLASPDPVVTIGRKCQPYPLEMIIRGYLSGSAWRAYRAGAREICGVHLPEGMRENQRFPQPIITPTTKAAEGHDQDISKEEIIKQGLVLSEEYAMIENYTRKLFEEGTRMAASRGLILVDTKYEFGRSSDGIFLIDEIHTPDSSRYFYADGYMERFEKGEPQRQLSKEFVREWLMQKGFMGRPGEVVPPMDDDWVQQISQRYIELYEKVTGQLFVPASDERPEDRIYENIFSWLEKFQKQF